VSTTALPLQISDTSKVKGYKKAFQRKNSIRTLMLTVVFIPQNIGLISDSKSFPNAVALIIVTDFSR
jgi:hypothetical protein